MSDSQTTAKLDFNPKQKAAPSNSRKGILAEQSGLTLVEVIAVIILIGLVGGVLFKGIFTQSDSAKAQINTVKMGKVKQALSNYRLQFNKYPSSLNGLIEGGEGIKGSGKIFTPMADKEDLVDIWDVPYIYKLENSGRSYTITSLGADGAAGGTGSDQDVTLKR